MRYIFFLGLFISSFCYSQQVTQSMKRLPDTGQKLSYTNTFGEDNDYNIKPPEDWKEKGWSCVWEKNGKIGYMDHNVKGKCIHEEYFIKSELRENKLKQLQQQGFGLSHSGIHIKHLSKKSIDFNIYELHRPFK